MYKKDRYQIVQFHCPIWTLTMSKCLENIFPQDVAYIMYIDDKAYIVMLVQ